MKYQDIPICEHEKKVEDFFLKFGEIEQNNSDKELKDIPTIIICFVNRSGSTLVASLLGRMGLCGKVSEEKNYEFFNDNVVIKYSERYKITSLEKYAQKVASIFCSQTGFFTTKLSPHQIFWLTKRKIIGDIYKKPIFLYVKRKNIVAQAISLSIAHQNRRWTSSHPESNVELIFKPEDIVSKMLLISRIYALFDLYFSLHSIQPITIYYEDLVNDPANLKVQLELNLNRKLQLDYKIDFIPKKQATMLNLCWEKKIREMYKISDIN